MLIIKLYKYNVIFVVSIELIIDKWIKKIINNKIINSKKCG